MVDEQTQEPLAGATVHVTNGSDYAATNEKGRFTLSSTSPIHRITVMLVGYATSEIDIKEKHEGLWIRLEPSNYTLNEVQVEGFAAEKKLLHTAASLSLMTARDLRRSNTVFLQNSLNYVPGVMMSVRSPASQSMIVLRGVGTYSRFSSRGIKLYMNGIPLSDADGTTSLDDIDFTSLGRLEVLKGPASSLYGANLAGVLLMQTRKAPYGQAPLTQTVTGGSFGLLRTNTSYSIGDDKVNALINYGHQQIDGFRQHSNTRKDFVNLAGDFLLGEKQMISLLANYTNFNDKYAGELDSLHFVNFRDSANINYILKDIGQKAEATRIGVSHSYTFTPEFANVSSVFANLVSTTSPVEPQISKSTKTKFGGRTLFTYNPVIGTVKTKFNLGAEFNSTFTAAKQFGIGTHGEYLLTKSGADSIRGNSEVNASQTNVFGQADVEIIENTTLTLGGSYNVVTYTVTDFLNPATKSGRRKFDPVFTPRVALIHTFDNAVSIFAQASTGFSPPTSSQITLNTTGVTLPAYINPDLKPERSTSYEIGSRGTVLSNLSYDVTLYTMTVKDALVAQAIAPGVTASTNAGKSSYTGLELSASYNLFTDGSVKGFRLLKPWIAYTHGNFKFEDYSILSYVRRPSTGRNDSAVVVSFSGNKVTGAVPNVFNAGLDYDSDFGAYVNFTYQWVDKMPLTDANTLFTDSYSLINVKAGYQFTFPHVGCELYAGVDNVGDTKYAATVAINAADKRYYAPAVGRNAYFGASLSFIP